MRRIVVLLVLSASLVVSLVFLLVLFIVRENPTKLPLEALGVTDYTALLADETEPEEENLSGTPYAGRRSAFLTVSTKKSKREELRAIARDLKTDEDYGGYDFLEVGFTDRYRNWPTKGFADVALTEEGEQAVEEWPEKPSSGSKNDDGVYFFEVEQQQKHSDRIKKTG